jgi:hypothetical protein
VARVGARRVAKAARDGRARWVNVRDELTDGVKRRRRAFGCAHERGHAPECGGLIS